MDATQKKVFLITGAAHGLGRALAENLNQPEHQLILIDKDLKALNKCYDELDAKGWHNIFLFPMDLAGSAQAEYTQLAEGLKSFNQLDGLFLNAAILPALTPIEHFDPLQWYEVIQTNLNANFHLIQTCLPKLKQSNQAWLVSISDQAVHSTPNYYGAYAIAKAGLEQLTRLVVAENPSLTGFIARLPALASHFRTKLYPGEPPCQNESLELAAQRILESCTEQTPHQDIEIIHAVN
ncbi:SDR family NAD(P)-dependent oxidoreductase [Thiomicrospira microaerophila]|uniref:SDR family NAD(P)-dependent oxidoreductase n=1 Tax=Thiomicrospira microaerophila TaxID=406020 RepID=UPI00200E5D8E|nr:SDR family NAD(P)-dependent oxidoreductase [Thiomicrospira microaerophila]UQB43096.1 SDR family NAD(P)-dependent oxidoreductase [Thiomicrospira microaerophila]